MQVIRFIRRLAGDCRGAAMIEYSLLVGLIAVALISALRAISTSSKVSWAAIWTAVQNAT